MHVLTYDTDHGYWKEMVRGTVSCVFISCKFICKSSEILSFTVNRFQQAEITLVFVPTSIFAFSYTTALK